ncbi:hypothetical protein P389DRAFT_168771 [Cystobasidium minutum MCA 4210]|uniref:uncharacterized protein n=1 Tax=Cystobasidium minutum MCA 4210 TaxID=1397322 RepID=UPI0034CDABB2|eukprot:jgi/Rhomi1/168771/fgenesh1_kg.3_\
MPSTMKLVLSGALGVVVLFSLIDMIISAVLVSSYNSSSYPSTDIKNVTRYTLFVSLWTLFLGGAYIFFILALGTSIIGSIISVLAFLFITWIFWIASAASTESSLTGSFTCANPEFAHCHQLLAMEAFAWMNFIILFASFVLVAYLAFRSTRSGSGLTGPVAV